MKRWLAEFECNSDLILPEDVGSVAHHFKDGTTAAFKNFDKEERKGFRVQITFESGNIDAAAVSGTEVVEDILANLTLISKMRISRPQLKFVLDWSPGRQMRDAYMFTDHSGDVWYPILNAGFLEATDAVRGSSNYQSLARAIDWFAAGVRAKALEDQFQFFWFSIEIAASVLADNAKVVDKCPRCFGDLICEKCGKSAKHRPYRKDLIMALLKSIRVPDEQINDLLRVRNLLLHGHNRFEIQDITREKNPDFEFFETSDLAGRVAAKAIFARTRFTEETEVKILDVESFANWQMNFKAHVQIGVPYSEEHVEFLELPMPKIGLVEGEERPLA